MADIRIVYDAVNALVSGADEPAKKLVQQALSYEIDGAGFITPTWDGKSTMFDWAGNHFPAGFVTSVVARLQKAGYRVQIARKPMVAPLGTANPVVCGYPANPDYDYQDETVERMVQYGGMIAQVATGGGKSMIACKALARIGRMTLFITTRSVLMQQMRENFQASLDWRAENGEPHLRGAQCGILGEGEFSVSKYVNVATVQTLASFLDEPARDATPEKRAFHLKRRELIARVLKSVSLLILEEAHEASGSNFYDIARMCSNADYRLALTATPFMKASAEANMRLMAVSGPIGIKVTESYLIGCGILATPYFLYRRCGYRPDMERIKADLKDKVSNARLGRTSPYQKAYQLGIVYNLERNTYISRSAREMVDHGLNVMVLVKHKRHGQILKEMIESLGARVDFIYGESKKKVRVQKLQALRNGTIDVLIGSTILDVGVDVPGVGGVILGGGDKAEVELRQRVGRGLRAKKGRANICFVVDFLDTSNNNLLTHSYSRKTIIDTTPGFGENVLPVDGNLPFSLLSASESTA